MFTSRGLPWRIYSSEKNWETHSVLMAVCMREYKEHVKVIQPHSTLMYIDMATVQDTATAPWLFNLYIDPKEELPVGHRMNPWLASLAAEMGAHAVTFKKYPPKKSVCNLLVKENVYKERVLENPI
jgi:hypothetical protein